MSTLSLQSYRWASSPLSVWLPLTHRAETWYSQSICVEAHAWTQEVSHRPQSWMGQGPCRQNPRGVVGTGQVPAQPLRRPQSHPPITSQLASFTTVTKGKP